MKPTCIEHQFLVHGILEANEEFHKNAAHSWGAVETECGIVLATERATLSDGPVTCIACISGEFEYQRQLMQAEALKLHLSIGTPSDDPRVVDLRKRLGLKDPS